MLKVIGIVCVIGCGAGCGMLAAAALRRQVWFCQTLRMLLEELAMMMRWNGDTLPVLLAALSEKPTYTPFPFLSHVVEHLETGAAFPEAWRTAVTQLRGMPEGVCQLLMTLGDVLGTSGMDGQEQTLLQATRQLMQMEQTLQTQSYRKGRLYRSLGILGGMAVALLLW